MFRRAVLQGDLRHHAGAPCELLVHLQHAHDQQPRQVQTNTKPQFLLLSPRYLVLTFMAPAYARKVFPCFDEPSFKATFDVVLVRKEAYSTIANMPLKTSEDRYAHSGWNVLICSYCMFGHVLCDSVNCMNSSASSECKELVLITGRREGWGAT